MDKLCRLCAKVNGNDINLLNELEDVSYKVEKYFNISIHTQDNLPTSICKDCYTFVSDIERYADHCLRVEQMFVELSGSCHMWSTDSTDINAYLSKYGVNEFVFKPLELEPFNDNVIIKEERKEDIQSCEEDIQSCEEDIQSCEEDFNESAKTDSESSSDINYITTKTATVNAKQHQCTICKKQFKTKQTLNMHIKSIHNFDPLESQSFKCEECGKSFKTKYTLKDHMPTHDKENPFQCHICKKSFKLQCRLKAHEDTHKNTNYSCPECGLKLNTKRTLRKHMIVHSNVKEYKCQYCDKEYKRAKNLKVHLILHTGMHPYKCQFCDRTFADGSNCRSHKKKVHAKELAEFEAAGGVQQTSLPKLSTLLTKTPKGKK